MQFNNSKHCTMSAKTYCEISETKKDYSACHTDNKLSFLPQERGKKYTLSMNFYILNSFFFSFNFHIAKIHIFAVLVTQLPVCFDKKRINFQATNSEMMQKCDASHILI